jgi:DNA polymerase-3 subunit beta
MRIKTTQTELFKRLQIVQGVISIRTTLPILSYFLLIAKNGKTTLFGTDLEVGVRCEILGDILEEGTVALPGKRVLELVREFPKGDIEISTEKNVASLKCAKARVQINTLPPDDFPDFPEIVGQKINIKGDILKSMIQKTILAVSREESRYTLTGVFLLLKGDSVEMVGTDGRRLSLVEETLEGETIKQKKSCILPVKTCNEILRVATDEPLSLTLGEKQVNFVQSHKPKTKGEDHGNISLTSRLIEGEFPDYNKVIPKNFQQKILLNRQELMEAVTRAYVLTKEKGGSVKFDIRKDSVTVSCKVPEVGESSEQIASKNGEKEIQIAFDPEYMLDALKVIDGKEVFLGLNSAKEAALFRPMDNEKFAYVLMPMEL